MRFKNYDYGLIRYDTISNYYFVHGKNVAKDSRIDDDDILNFIDHTSFNPTDTAKISAFHASSMKFPSIIKPNELMFF